jgi:hypothetical protein
MQRLPTHSVGRSDQSKGAGMTEQYEIKTYPTGKIFLPEGWYSRAELMELVKWMDGANQRNKALFDAALLSSKPGQLKGRGKK